MPRGSSKGPSDEGHEDEHDSSEVEDDPIDLDDLPSDWRDVVESRLAPFKVERRRTGAEDKKTLDEVFDKSTLLILYKFISNGHLETLDYPISTGKEGNVFHATTPQGESMAVKIYRTNTATFRSFMTYIQGDPRFGHVRPNRRDVVYVWAQKEYKNLQRYFEAGVRVPTPVAWRENVLLMEYVGVDGHPAPRLKDAPPDDPQKAYETIVDQYRLGVEKGRLVHGDLSEFNVLNTGEELVVIDVAQAVLREHPMAAELLQRDAKNLAAYFRKLGVKATPEETLKRMTPEKPRPDDDEEA